MRRVHLAVVGDPVARSRSPAMHNAALDALGIDGEYRAVRVDRSGLEEIATDIRTGQLTGANITMPHKRAAFLLSDSVTERAGRAESVNTWVMQSGRLHGDSTDVPAIGVLWRRHRLPEDRPVLVLGTGGAARAAVVGLEDRLVSISGRRDEATRRLVRDLGIHIDIVDWGDAPAGAVLVNATPLGMNGETLPTGLLDRASGLLDMAYGVETTPSVAAARAKDVPVADGIDMLVAQAELSFQAWTGLVPPAGVMERAARNPSRAG